MDKLSSPFLPLFQRAIMITKGLLFTPRKSVEDVNDLIVDNPRTFQYSSGSGLWYIVEGALRTIWNWPWPPGAIE
jgi:hypothetical protein